MHSWIFARLHQGYTLPLALLLLQLQIAMHIHLQSTMDCALLSSAPVQWRKQYAAFSRTSAGQAVFVAALVLLCYTGLIFKLLNLLFILWWFAPLIILPLLSVAGRKVISSLTLMALQGNPMYRALRLCNHSDACKPQRSFFQSAGCLSKRHAGWRGDDLYGTVHCTCEVQGLQAGLSQRGSEISCVVKSWTDCLRSL